MNPEEMYWRFVNELLIALKINRYLIILNILMTIMMVALVIRYGR